MPTKTTKTTKTTKPKPTKSAAKARKKVAKKPSSELSKASSAGKKSAKGAVGKSTTGKKVQLPSPYTPFLAIVAAVMTYVSVSLAIDSGSYWHYAAAFYFTYQSVRLTKNSIQARKQWQIQK